ncbi:hypothetical protein EHS13_23670 [Paenibacillus psychroresistens]|uniref:DUF3221 domain-containing protein n=1 Tax=Paenibacillus psychroresistens TaxID=1778678 RepID=A0A6B8RPD9_9BACL|nr:hypothetical protein [Paenibacillus psychroresistens]QGQ97674.1 hypothetical protein EHS13_23670 [Paenibacillus psychroresistens]
MNKLYFSVTILFVLLLSSGCNKNYAINPNDIDNIKLELVNISKLPQGTSYAIKLKNGSKHIIKQNVVYLSYPIKQPNGQTGNKFKIEANGNKLDIKPNEVITLNVFAPIQEYENNNNLIIENPNVEIKGFIDEVKAENQFNKGGGVQLTK